MRRCIDEAYDNSEGRHTMNGGSEANVDADDNVSEAAGLGVGAVRFEAVTGTCE